MSSVVYVRLMDADDDIRTQKCLIPYNLMKHCSFKPGDIVSIACGSEIFICRIFLLSPVSLENCIIIDDTVKYGLQFPENIERRLAFPDGFSFLKTSYFEQLDVKLIIGKSFLISYGTNKHRYRSIVSKLIQNFIIRKSVVVKCCGLELADMFGIRSIIISDTNLDEEICGRITKTTNIVMKEILLEEEYTMLKKLKDTRIGGIDDLKKVFNFYLFQKMSKRILIVGPSGGGKSLFAKKFFSDLKCSLIMIDGMKKCVLLLNECSSYCDYLVQSSFPNHPSVLFVDHIDKLAPCEAKPPIAFPKFLATLVNLFTQLKDSNVYIIATAVQRKYIHPAVSTFFEEELFLGIPTVKQRKEILQTLIRSPAICPSEFDKIASMMPGFIACDIVQLIDEAFKKIRASNEISDECLNVLHLEQALSAMTPSILKTSEWSLKVTPVHWKDIGGMSAIKKRLQMCVEKPLLYPEVFEKVDLHCPNGVLLFGPPGCCKTTLARGLATECNANFFAANPSQIYSAYVGESEKNISQLFYQARLCAPSIIFLDELDSLVGFRDLNTKQQGVAEKVLSTLLNEMDGCGIKADLGENIHSDAILKDNAEGNYGAFEKKNLENKVIVVAATNRPDCIDNALLRSGRFDVVLYVPHPNCEERESILLTVTDGMPLYNVDFKEIAEKTEFFTGADLKNLCNMAAMEALRQDMLHAEYVTQDNFIQVLKILQPSVTKEQVEMYEQLSAKFGPIISH